MSDVPAKIVFTGVQRITFAQELLEKQGKKTWYMGCDGVPREEWRQEDARYWASRSIEERVKAGAKLAEFVHELENRPSQPEH